MNPLPATDGQSKAEVLARLTLQLVHDVRSWMA